MSSEAPIFSADQIQVPEDLPSIMKELTKFIIKEQAAADQELSKAELISLCNRYVARGAPVCLPVCPSVCLPVCLSFCLCLPLCLSLAHRPLGNGNATLSLSPLQLVCRQGRGGGRGAGDIIV